MTSEQSDKYAYCKKVNRKVQEEPQADVAANPWHQEKEKKGHKLTCAQLTYKCTIRPKTSSPSNVIKMLKGQKKHIDKEQGKTSMKRLVV